jgi:hypothetical protein
MRIDTVGHLKYLDECGDEGNLVGLILASVLALPTAGDCAVCAHLWFPAIDLLASHPPYTVRAILWFKMCMKLS